MNYKDVIESRYNRKNWLLLLRDIFGNKAKFWSTPYVVETDSQMARQALWLGTISLSDEQTIAIYEVELAESVDIERNRRGIRDMLLTQWRNNGNAGAFMFCYRENESVLRFSYVSESWKFADDGTYQKESTDTRRFTYLLGEGHRSRTAIQQFETLKGSAQTLKDLTKAFSVDAVSDMFFRDYKAQYANIIFYITGKRMVKKGNKWEEIKEGRACRKILDEFSGFADPEKAVRDYVKKLMGRLVFLQFLQKKGWLGVPLNKDWGSGDKEFIQNLFAKTRDKDSFIDDVLEVLFNDLNTERKNDISQFSLFDYQFKIPYLNGGLFERDATDETRFPLPAKYMEDMLEFFSRYNFTIDENDPNDAEVGVDPEMLGRIFENLLEDNKDKGAFYTPKEIVQYMCRESLIAYLQTDVKDESTKEAIRQFVTTHEVEHLGDNKKLAEQVDESLRNVKICDPAIGSGAFPMGLLKELYLCRSAIEGLDDDNASEIKKHIIQHNIYGVDIEKGAVDIARLRFWLSLIVDEKTPHALPNLDFKIMQGNSLLEHYKGVDLSAMTQEKKERGKNYQTTMFDDMLDVYRRELREMLNEYYQCTDHKEKKTLRKRIIDNVKKQLKEQSINIDFGDLDLSGNDQFFLWHTWFHDVFSQGGFDIVIGNPPYVQMKKGTVPISLFPFSEGKDKGKQNLYKLFIEHSYNLSQRKGVCCLITQSSLMCDVSAQYTRKLLLTLTTIEQIIEFPKIAPHKEGQLFKDALVATCIILYKKIIPSKSHTLRLSAYNDLLTLDKFDFAEMYQNVPIKFYPNGYCLPLIRHEEFSVIEKIYSRSGFLSEFVNDTSQGDINLTNESFCFSSIRTAIKMYRGKHVHRYQLDENVQEFIQDGYKDDVAMTNKSKTYLICQQISGMVDKHRFNFTISRKEKCIFGNSINKIELSKEVNIFVILAILNSNLIDWLFRRTSTNNHVNIYEIEQLPIPIDTKKYNESIVLKVETILQAKKDNPYAEITKLECEIDCLVYHLYNLNYDEVKIIDPETPITREEYEKEE